MFFNYNMFIELSELDLLNFELDTIVIIADLERMKLKFFV